MPPAHIVLQEEDAVSITSMSTTMTGVSRVSTVVLKDRLQKLEAALEQERTARKQLETQIETLTTARTEGPEA